MSESAQLLDGPTLLERLFPEGNRPSTRWLQRMQKQRTIPFVKLGRLIFFDEQAVREAIKARHTIQRRP